MFLRINPAAISKS